MLPTVPGSPTPINFSMSLLSSAEECNRSRFGQARIRWWLPTLRLDQNWPIHCLKIVHCSSCIATTLRQLVALLIRQYFYTHTQQEALIFFDGTYTADKADDHHESPCDDKQVGSREGWERGGEGSKVSLGNSQPDAHSKDPTTTKLRKKEETSKVSHSIQAILITIFYIPVVASSPTGLGSAYIHTKRSQA